MENPKCSFCAESLQEHIKKVHPGGILCRDNGRMYRVTPGGHAVTPRGCCDLTPGADVKHHLKRQGTGSVAESVRMHINKSGIRR